MRLANPQRCQPGQLCSVASSREASTEAADKCDYRVANVQLMHLLLPALLLLALLSAGHVQNMVPAVRWDTACRWYLPPLAPSHHYKQHITKQYCLLGHTLVSEGDHCIATLTGLMSKASPIIHWPSASLHTTHKEAPQ